MAPIMPIIIIPIISSVVVGLIFIFLIGAPISNIFEALTTWLKVCKVLILLYLR